MVQLTLRAKTWGGAREGAGRPRLKRRSCEPHVRRPPLSNRTPVHVVQRVLPAVGRLRRRDAYRVVRAALARMLGRADFRVVHVSIQQTHLHLLVEAADQRALARGMQAFLISVAKGLNRACARTGTVFPQRYHAAMIASPRHARSEIAYVLNNWRKHGEDRGTSAAIDRYASGLAFDGWRIAAPFARPPAYAPLPVAAPTTWLLTVGWRRHGLIAPREVPGRAR